MIILEESPWYNEILRRLEERGRQEEASALILRLLERRLSAVNADKQDQVRSLPLEQLEALGEALLDFKTIADLTTWLDHHPV
jgi:predicted transposase YdaD